MVNIPTHQHKPTSSTEQIQEHVPQVGSTAEANQIELLNAKLAAAMDALNQL